MSPGCDASHCGEICVPLLVGNQIAEAKSCSSGLLSRWCGDGVVDGARGHVTFNTIAVAELLIVLLGRAAVPFLRCASCDRQRSLGEPVWFTIGMRSAVCVVPADRRSPPCVERPVFVPGRRDLPARRGSDRRSREAYRTAQ